jgi:uncharacterized membrane protein YfbV (UPF0208 family)
VIKREKWPAPYMPLVAVVTIVGNLIRGEVRLAVIIAVFSVVVITLGTLIGNAVAARRDKRRSRVLLAWKDPSMAESSERRESVTSSRLTGTLVAAVLAAVLVVALLLGGVYFLAWGTGEATEQFCEKRNDCSDVGR